MKTTESGATWVWLILVLLTLVTYGFGRAGLAGPVIMGLLLVSMIVKGHFIIADFMGLRSVALKWRWLVHGWLLLVMVLIAVAYMNPS